MPQSLARNGVHLIFSTKHREPFILPAVRDELFPYLDGMLNAIDCPAIRVGGVADHVHLLFVLSKNVALSKAVEEVKKESSKWAKGKVHPKFYWQTGYGAFSVSASMEDAVAAYIDNQENNHRARTFQDEVREFFRRHRMELDEEHFWD